MEEKKDYQDAYEKEHYKAVYLANRVAELEDQVDDLQFKLNRIKNNPIWKASGPARKCMHFVIRQKDRLKNCGSLSGVIAKVRYKSWEKKAMTHYGTQSFPSAEERQKQEAAVFERMPKISILVPLWNTPESFLTEMIGSVQWQTYKNWELCLADGSDDAHAYVGEYCKRLAAQDSRIVYQKLAKNEGISGNTNESYKLATGEFIGLFDHDDILHPCALYEYVKAINEKDADFIYCDEATFKSPDINKMITMHFKPDYAIDNLRANNYICHFSVFSRELLDGTELFRTKFDGSQDHDMILRLTDNAKHIVHVPKLLYYWRSHAGSVAGNIEAKPYVVEAARGAVADHLRRHGFKNFTITSTRAFETIFKISYEIIGEPKISIIIPNKDHVEDLRRFFDHYLKGIDNGWEKTPRVRLSVLNPGGKDIVGRPENEFPLARTQYERLYLSASDSTLQTSLPAKEAVNVYRSEDENHQVTYRYRMDKPTEITGYMKLHLWVAAPDNDDMDLSVSVEKLSKDGKPLPDKTGSLIAATGMMRVSMRQLDEAKSTEAEPYYPFTTEQKLKPGEIVPVEIEIWPMGLLFDKGEILQLTVGAYYPAKADIPFGSAPISIPKEGYTYMPGQNVEKMTIGGNATECADANEVVKSPATHNVGRHCIYTGGKYDSYLYVPVIPAK